MNHRMLLFAVTAVMALIGWAQANTDPYYGRRATLFDELPIGKKDIVMLGNSLTDGAEWNELLDNRHVKNRGIVGDIVQGYIDRLEPILKGQPKKIFILGGVNDISHDVSGDSIARAMERLIVLIKTRSPRTKIYLQSMLPFNNDLYPLFVDGQGRLRAEYTNDGLHLMGKAYLVWRDAIKPYAK